MKFLTILLAAVFSLGTVGAVYAEDATAGPGQKDEKKVAKKDTKKGKKDEDQKRKEEVKK
jgi:hypothetical protein